LGVRPISPEPTDVSQHSPDSNNSSDFVNSSSEEKEKRRKDKTKSTTPVDTDRQVPVTKVIFSLLPSNCCIKMFLFGREMDQHRKLAKE